MNLDMAALQPIRRKRAFLPKVKTGCGTCKYGCFLPTIYDVCAKVVSPEYARSSVTRLSQNAIDVYPQVGAHLGLKGKDSQLSNNRYCMQVASATDTARPQIRLHQVAAA